MFYKLNFYISNNVGCPSKELKVLVNKLFQLAASTENAEKKDI